MLSETCLVVYTDKPEVPHSPSLFAGFQILLLRLLAMKKVNPLVSAASSFFPFTTSCIPLLSLTFLSSPFNCHTLLPPTPLRCSHPPFLHLSPHPRFRSCSGAFSSGELGDAGGIMTTERKWAELNKTTSCTACRSLHYPGHSCNIIALHEFFLPSPIIFLIFSPSNPHPLFSSSHIPFCLSRVLWTFRWSLNTTARRRQTDDRPWRVAVGRSLAAPCGWLQLACRDAVLHWEHQVRRALHISHIQLH